MSGHEVSPRLELALAGDTSPLPAVLRPGMHLAGRYELIEEIGRGGMGQVFRAHDEALGRDVAIKVLDRSASGDTDFEEATAHEARAVARLVHHGIVTVFDVGSHEGHRFLVMELVTGRPLGELLREEGPPAPARAAGIAAEVAEALAYAHRHGVLHCDVKPQNIIVLPDGGTKLVDFGIARAASATATLSSEEIYGSVPYLAPEQVRGERLDGRTDIYALGAVLYEMLVGRPPFEGRNVAAALAQRLTADPPSPRASNRAVSPALDRVVLTALGREPDRRFADAVQLRDALRGVAQMAESETVRIDRTAVVGPADRGASAPPRQDWPEAFTLSRANRSVRPAPAAGRSAPAGRLVGGAAGSPRPTLGRRELDELDAGPGRRKGLPLPLLAGAAALVLALLLGAVLFRSFGQGAGAVAGAGDGSGLPGEGWATFSKASCEWSNVRTPPGICFGERQAGFRVRVLKRDGERWEIWDPTTQNIAYVDRDALLRE